MGPELGRQAGRPGLLPCPSDLPLCILSAAWDYHPNKTTPKPHVQVGFPPF